MMHEGAGDAVVSVTPGWAGLSPPSNPMQIAPHDVTKGELAVRYITHEFSHPETLDRAHRWLIQAGFDPGRIEMHHQGTPRIAVSVEPGEAAVVEMVISAAESGDPDGPPSLWDLVRQHHIHPQSEIPAEASAPEAHTTSFVVSWHPVDAEYEVTEATTNADVEVHKALAERWE